MIMYHKGSSDPVDVHPSKIEEMKAKGWKAKKPTTRKPKKAEVIEDGES